MTRYIYRLTAFRDGRKVLLAEYRGDTEGMYGYRVERVEEKCERREPAP